MATVRLGQKNRALTRAVPDSFDRALANFFGSGPTDIRLLKHNTLLIVKPLLMLELKSQFFLKTTSTLIVSLSKIKQLSSMATYFYQCQDTLHG